jgi:hypothetical protein
MSSSPHQRRTFAPPRQDTPSPRSSSISLAAAATINAADLSRRSSTSNRGSPGLGRPSERRRSTALNINLNDPTIPSPGELSSSDHRASIGHSYTTASPTSIGGMRTLSNGDPHHQRTPSLGEIHQELEQEQEAQVNRMLQMIRQQQAQLDEMRNQPGRHSRHHSGSGTGAAIVDDLTPVLEQSPAIHPIVPPTTRPVRRYSRGAPSASPSPGLRPRLAQEMTHTGSSSGEWPPSPVDIVRRNSLRDESTFFQAETASLTRENQMLRLRIRELERQINDMNATQANTPPIPSNLATSPPVDGLAGPILSEENKT